MNEFTWIKSKLLLIPRLTQVKGDISLFFLRLKRDFLDSINIMEKPWNSVTSKYTKQVDDPLKMHFHERFPTLYLKWPACIYYKSSASTFCSDRFFAGRQAGESEREISRCWRAAPRNSKGNFQKLENKQGHSTLKSGHGVANSCNNIDFIAVLDWMFGVARLFACLRSGTVQRRMWRST